MRASELGVDQRQFNSRHMSISATWSALPSISRSILNRKRLRRVVEFVAGSALLIRRMVGGYAGGLVDAICCAPPFALADTWKNIVSGSMNRDFLQTLLRVTYAFGICPALGVPHRHRAQGQQLIYRSVESLADRLLR